MFSKRSKLSLCQYLALLGGERLLLLLEKHDIQVQGYVDRTTRNGPEVSGGTLRDSLMSAADGALVSLLTEIVTTRAQIRLSFSPRYAHDDRFDDLVNCLRLDGYNVEDNRLIPLNPSIEGSAPVEDDLTVELRISGLSEAEGVLDMLNKSAQAFCNQPPDYNACLTNARVALQTLATGIARAQQRMHPGSFDETKYGQVLAYLRSSGLVTVQEEKGLGGVFEFVSPGAHQPVGLEEDDAAMLGRSLVAHMCYFLIKTFNAPTGSSSGSTSPF